MKAIIFDLDYCLCPGDAVGRTLYEPVFGAVRAANRGSLTDDRLAAAFADCWSQPFDHVAHRYGFSESMLAAGWRIFTGMEMTGSMQGYADLGLLQEFTPLKFLVTSGFRRLQESKIRALGIEAWFTAIHIDAIDEPGRQGKQGIFAGILASHGFAPGEVLVVGDNPQSEIQAANQLGIPSVQILRPGVAFGGNALHHIAGLEELKLLLS